MYKSVNRNDGHLQQEWMMVPVLIDGLPDRNSVHGYVPEHNIWQCPGKQQMHYTSIWRIWYLAAKHPFVDEAEQVKKPPATHNVDRETGRATKGHQSEFNISITLAASGAKMLVGLTANATNKSLLALWWSPGKGCFTDHNQLAIAESIFYDIAEAEHKVPQMFQAMMQPLAQTPQPQQQQMNEVERQGQEKEKQMEESWEVLDDKRAAIEEEKEKHIEDEKEQEKMKQEEKKKRQEQEKESCSWQLLKDKRAEMEEKEKQIESEKEQEKREQDEETQRQGQEKKQRHEEEEQDKRKQEEEKQRQEQEKLST